ncbi:MAG: hypothetical protein EB116_18245 [Betaproteobacteria bacterium]|nr:hypothetical protein [Betaproteobacteria bacterium]
MAHPPSIRAKIAINGITVIAPLALGTINALLFPARNEAKDRRDDVEDRTDHYVLFDVQTNTLQEVDNFLKERVISGCGGQLDNDACGQNNTANGGNNLGPV